MNIRILTFILLLFLFSCEKDEIESDTEYSSEINFEVSEWILTGKDISCLDFDKDGNVWIGSGSKLISYASGETEEFDVGSTIKDIAVAPSGNVWVGTKDKGLAKFSGGTFDYYTMENSIIPRDYIPEVVVTSSGKVWFSSAAHDLGGLMNYDGRNFRLYTPENSIMNQHVIDNLKADGKNNVYFNTMGKVGMAAVFKSDSDGKLSQPGGDASFYWIREMDINSNGEIYLGVNYSLSSYSGNKNFIGYYDLNEWKALETDFDYYYRVFVDKRDYVWSMGSEGGDFTSFFVFDGEEWHRSIEGSIPDANIHSIKVDNQNKIWFCTNDGIYILAQ